MAIIQKLFKCVHLELATLLEGAGYFFNISKVNFQTYSFKVEEVCEVGFIQTS